MTETLTAFEGGHVPDLAPGATPLVQRFVSIARTDDDQLSDAARPASRSIDGGSLPSWLPHS
jgi:hypothetical protein